MPSVADIFRQYGSAYRESYGDRILPSHLAVMHAIETCRTEEQGGHVYDCPDCGKEVYSYHSCKNRHCPTCQQSETDEWIEKRTKELLPVDYFLITFTVPSELRGVIRSNQKSLYSLLFHTAAKSLQKLAYDPDYVGGYLGMIAVLHTWTKQMNYHPHVHMLVPSIGIAVEGDEWVSCKTKEWLVPVKALSVIFRAKMKSGMKQLGFYEHTPREAWDKSWVVHCKPVGLGKPTLKYLSQYVYRTAISNNRILSVDDGKVTFLCRESDSDHDPNDTKRKWIKRTVDAHEFIRRFLQHALPPYFVRVRYYGFLSAANRKEFQRLRAILVPSIIESAPSQPGGAFDSNLNEHSSTVVRLYCPLCGQELELRAVITPHKRAPP
jgi:predicted RNA-binding Zn-ribbon protein involved in translation (DUF1610 family)